MHRLHVWLLATITLFSGLATSSDCAAAAASYNANSDPDALTTVIPANVTYDCISSIPVQKDYSQRILESLRAWIELESQLECLRKPSKGYLWDSINVLAELDRITNNLTEYTSQYAFEVDLITLGLHFHDFHTMIKGGINTIVQWDRGRQWDRGIPLVSVSSDGFEDPRVYLFSDVAEIDTNHNLALVPSSGISPVQTINGLPVQQFLQTQQLVAYSHDPDTMYNQLFLSIPQSLNPMPQVTTFTGSSAFYPGSETRLGFENGSDYTKATTASISCAMGNITTGQEFWDTCIYSGDEASATAATDPPATAPDVPAMTRLFAHPDPVAIDPLGLFSGYFLHDSDYSDVAVMVIRSFAGFALDTYMESFQHTLQTFLEQATSSGKTKLVIDVQGNGGGLVNAGVELVAQLFPNSPLDQKGTYRASTGYEIILERQGAVLDLVNQQSNGTIESLLNEVTHPLSWQVFMSPNTSGFSSFKDWYGPQHLSPGDGSYTNFFQTDYTNTDPSDLNDQEIQITGYGERILPLDTPPPFDPKNMVLVSDGFCGSTCAIVHEYLTNVHQIPAIAVGGRPGSGPMQTVGNTKGSQAFNTDWLPILAAEWNNDTLVATDRAKAKGTVFENWSSFAIDQGTLLGLNAKNNYRIGDGSNTPLQMVYTAADCKMWYTPKMLVDPVHVWSRAADIAFAEKPFTSEYCVKGSTGHGSSVTRGLKKGSLGDQTPPANAKPQYLGWLKDGVEIVQGFSLVSAGVEGESGGNGSGSSIVLSDAEMKQGLSDLKSMCGGYDGDRWLFKMICGVLG
ncbi:hypothetical protein PMZ80_006736 [Knufia obscura]|uniref:Tail specific protease domain-containing protein n=2 Tax=Knufia TaxID=430999 RepID=A0AAN8I3D0_9EURO|nr:hypothetical protein PMZ80_006736 [Knufia obscura]KAK5948275.1 hypothetical protein OHC33_010709 [Knufia fluminis]